MNNYFSIGADEYERRTPWSGDSLLLRQIASDIPAHGKVQTPYLEIASGSARIARYALQEGIGPWIALDVEPSMLPKAETNLLPLVGDGARLPFKSESIACAVTWSGLHYVGASTGLGEMLRVLAPGGKAIAAQKVADNLRQHVDWYRDVQLARSTAPREWYFSDDLAGIGVTAGLELVRVRLYRQVFRMNALDWASRKGYFDERTTRTLLGLASRGYEREFVKRTGFSFDGTTVQYPIDWAVVTWQKP